MAAPRERTVERADAKRRAARRAQGQRVERGGRGRAAAALTEHSFEHNGAADTKKSRRIVFESELAGIDVLLFKKLRPAEIQDQNISGFNSGTMAKQIITLLVSLFLVLGV